MSMANKTQQAAPMKAYETDFYGWAYEEAARMRGLAEQGLLSAEAVAVMEAAAEIKAEEVHQHMVKLFAVLLEWTYHPLERCTIWHYVIKGERINVDDLLARNASLQEHLPRMIERAYSDARETVEAERNVKADFYPDLRPWTFLEAMNLDFYPA